jgi:hypothetical protein
MNVKGCGRKQSWPKLNYCSGICLEGLTNAQTEQLGLRSRFELRTSQIQNGCDVQRGSGTSNIVFMLRLACVLYHVQVHIPSATSESHTYQIPSVLHSPVVEMCRTPLWNSMPVCTWHAHTCAKQSQCHQNTPCKLKQ